MKPGTGSYQVADNPALYLRVYHKNIDKVKTKKMAKNIGRAIEKNK